MKPIVGNRYDILRAMNAIVYNMNNEDAYLSWISYVPDEATDDDLMSIAESEKSTTECTELFCHIIEVYGKYGFYYTSDDLGGVYIDGERTR